MTACEGVSLRPVPVVQKSMIFHDGGEFAVPIGPCLYTPTIVPTTTFNNNGGVITFNVPPPDKNIAMARMLFIKWYFQITLNMTAGLSGWAVQPGVSDAPRAFPATQVITTVSAQLNNSSVTLQPYYLINALMNCNVSNELKARWFSQCPCMIDEYQNYNDANVQYSNVAAPGVTRSNVQGVVSDPLQSLGQSPANFQTSRGSYPLNIIQNDNVAAGNPATAVIQFSSMEPIWVSPFNGTNDDYSIMGLTNFQIQCTLGDMSRIWSHNNGPAVGSQFSTFNNATVSLYTNPEVHVIWMTPPEAIPVPMSLVYPYSLVNYYTTSANGNTPINGLTDFTVTTQNIQLTSIPNRILIFAQRTKSTQDVTTSDTFAQLKSIQIQYDNQSGMLSSASAEDLYYMSYMNGYEGSWIQWSQTKGSVFILDTTKNFALNRPDEAPSISTNKQFQITATFKNLNVHPVLFDVWIVTISSGAMQIAGGQTDLNSTVLTQQDVMSIKASGTRMVAKESNTFYGTGLQRIKTGLRSAGRKVYSGLKRAHDYGQQTKILSRGLQTASNIAGIYQQPALTMGLSNASKAARELGYGMYGAGGYRGGAMMSQQELHERAMEDEEDEDDGESEEY